MRSGSSLQGVHDAQDLPLYQLQGHVQGLYGRWRAKGYSPAEAAAARTSHARQLIRRLKSFVECISSWHGRWSDADKQASTSQTA